MAKAYLIAHIRVHDKEKFAEFAAMAGPSIAQYGGRVLAKGPNADHREGDLRSCYHRVRQYGSGQNLLRVGRIYRSQSYPSDGRQD